MNRTSCLDRHLFRRGLSFEEQEPWGATMLKFMIHFKYSSASWARMLAVSDDRASAVSELLGSLGGRLECIYWDVENASGYVICDLPDSLSAAAALTATTRTGAFKDVEVSELLTQDQLRSVVALAKTTESVYQPPGMAAVEDPLG